MGGAPELFAGVLGRPSVGGRAADQDAGSVVVPELGANPQPTELEHSPLGETDYKAIDEALGDGWEIHSRNTPSDIRTAWITPQGLHSDTYEGFGLTFGDAIRSAIGRKHSGDKGLFRPPAGVQRRYMNGVPISRSSLDSVIGDFATAEVRRASLVDPVVIRVRGRFYRGGGFQAAVADFASKNPSPHAP